MSEIAKVHDLPSAQASREAALAKTQAVLISVFGEYLNDPAITELMANPDGKLFCERSGALEVLMRDGKPAAMSKHSIDMLSRNLGGLQGQGATDESSAILNMDFKQLRINIVSSRLTGGALPCVTIRKRPETLFRMADLVGFGAISEQNAKLLMDIVRHGDHNVVIAGGTASGKTTVLNALIDAIPDHKRILTLEDTRELQVQKDHWVAMNTNDAANIGMGKLLASTLRMRPDRLLIGELRGAEAFVCQQAFNTGHSGGMTTVHANSAFDALQRLEALFAEHPAARNVDGDGVRSRIASSFHVIVSTQRVDGKRRIVEAIRILGYRDRAFQVEPIFKT
jgi:Flp pilus assembly CpaF family ATPase